MKIYDLYGVRAVDLEVARSLIERRLGISLVAHQGDYRGGAYYRLGHPGGEHFELQRNYIAFEDDWTVPEHQDIPFLLFVNETPRSAELMKTLNEDEAIALLQHQEV